MRCDTPAQQFKIREEPSRQPGRLKNKLRACLKT